ncbi:methyl-accepting chemotaxis protein [Pelagibacterium halotolerans]|uniref:methyl-accepting chemotaxis protein n=1 Tax=Pelagibacterium halotolerans TaxID=531813 RepID=UPI00384B52D3
MPGKGGIPVRISSGFKLPQLRIAQKLPIAFLLSALIVSLGVGVVSYLIGSQTVSALTGRQLETISIERTRGVENFLGVLRDDVSALAGSDATATAVRDYGIAWNQLADPTAILQEAFIANNPNAPEERYLMDSADMRENYNFTHGRYHPGMRSHALTRGYGDIAIVNADGHIVYTVAKRDDFATSVTDGVAADTAVAEVYARAMADLEAGQVAFSDLAAYPANGGAAAVYAGAPVFDNRGKKVGAVVAEIPGALFSAQMERRTGLGETGESFIVGRDALMRTDSPFTESADPLVTEFTDPVVAEALEAGSAQGISTDYRGMDMLVEANAVDFPGLEWVVVTAMSAEEAFAPVTDMRNMMLGIGAVLLVAVGAVGLIFSRTLSKPVTRVTDTMERLAAGDLDIEVRDAGRRDEIGAMARAVEVFRTNAQKVVRMSEDEVAREEAARRERAEMMQDLQRSFGAVVDAAIAGDFSQRVDASFPDEELNRLAASVNTLVETVETGLSDTGEVLSALAQADLTHRMDGDYQGAFAQLRDDTNAVAEKIAEIVSQLRTTSGALKAATGEILSGANDLSERTTRQAATIEETSASMEQLSTTVLQNAERAQNARSSAQDAQQTAESGGKVMENANEAMERITASSSRISDIIGMIDDIAFQTNLLALNASVEAARAGEAGKGFAVVAVEVRRLAQSAAQASSEVKALIEQSVTEVQGGTRLVAQAGESLGNIVTAVRSMNALMNEIADESRDQAHSIEELSAAVRQLDEMTQHNAALVEETNAAIEQTEAQARDLDRIVDIFTIEGAAPEAEAGGIKGLQNKVVRAAQSYLTRGNAAVDAEWAEF